MNKFYVLLLLLLTYHFGFTQCDQTVVFKCEKAVEWKNGVRGQEIAMPVTITMGKAQFEMVVSMNGVVETVKGEIKEVLTCNWTLFLKEGKASYLVLAAKSGGAASEGKVEIENNRDELHIFMGDPNTADRLQFIVSEYTVEESAAAAEQPQVLKKRKRGRQ